MSKIYSKSDLITMIAQNTDLTRVKVEQVLDALATTVRTKADEGCTVVLPGLGRFSQKARAERTGRNPRTGEPITIAATTTLAFKPTKPAVS